MTKDEALLLAVANARGLCILTDRESKEMNRVLRGASEDIRVGLAAEAVRQAQDGVHSINAAATGSFDFECAIQRLSRQVDHLRDVEQRIVEARDMLQPAAQVSAATSVLS
jgi:hypothetical protein